MTHHSRFALVASAIVALALAASPAAAAPQFAPADTATIRPGSATTTNGAACTANFVFHDAQDRLYLGQAAHCSGQGAATQVNGCEAEPLPLGTPVDVEGAAHPATLAYSSWNAMRARNETDLDACRFNDLALLALDPADYGRVNPTVPFWGGPQGIADVVAPGSAVYSYGNSPLRLGLDALKPKTGLKLAPAGPGWSHTVLTASPGIPGDSGSAFLDDRGRAFGVLSTLALAPLAGSNGVGDLGRELAYANLHGQLGTISLANGTEPFSALPLAPATTRGLLSLRRR